MSDVMSPSSRYDARGVGGAALVVVITVLLVLVLVLALALAVAGAGEAKFRRNFAGVGGFEGGDERGSAPRGRRALKGWGHERQARPAAPFERMGPDAAAPLAAFSAYTPEETEAIRRVSAAELPPPSPWYCPETSPTIPYRPTRVRKGPEDLYAHRLVNLHLGQRKLFVSELQALTHFLPEAGTRAVVLYAGAAPGVHTPHLAALFGGVEFHLYDPAPFSSRLSEGATAGRIHTYREFFTDAVAASWAGRCDIFICDIRLGRETAAEFEHQVAEDMAAQDRWTRTIAPRMGAMLKFRLPYVGAGAGKTPYLAGRALWQAWPSPQSSELRLFVPPAACCAPPAAWDPAHYQDAAAYRNVVERPWATYCPPAPDLETVPGYDRCRDCAQESGAWVDYLALPGARGSVAGHMRALGRATGQGLDTFWHPQSKRRLHGFRPELPAPARLEAFLALPDAERLVPELERDSY